MFVILVQNGWAVVQRGSAAEPYLRRLRGQGERVPAVLGCQLRRRVTATTRTSHGLGNANLLRASGTGWGALYLAAEPAEPPLALPEALERARC